MLVTTTVHHNFTEWIQSTTRKWCPNQQKLTKFLLIWVLYWLFSQFLFDLALVNKMVNKFLLIQVVQCWFKFLLIQVVNKKSTIFCSFWLQKISNKFSAFEQCLPPKVPWLCYHQKHSKLPFLVQVSNFWKKTFFDTCNCKIL